MKLRWRYLLIGAYASRHAKPRWHLNMNGDFLEVPNIPKDVGYWSESFGNGALNVRNWYVKTHRKGAL